MRTYYRVHGPLVCNVQQNLMRSGPASLMSGMNSLASPQATSESDHLKGYNGPQYNDNDYDTKMEQATRPSLPSPLRGLQRL
jgi:hypothetical protein